MKIEIEIDDKLAEEIGLKANRKMIVEEIELGERVPIEVTGEKYVKGILISTDEMDKS